MLTFVSTFKHIVKNKQLQKADDNYGDSYHNINL